MATTEIHAYQVRYSANTFRRCIWLKNNGRYIGLLFFNPNGSVLPQDNFENIHAYAVLNYHLDDFQNVLDILRNEKPLYLLYKGPGLENCIQTEEEMPGENE